MAKDMQAVADLGFLEFAQIGIDAFQQLLVGIGLRARSFKAEFAQQILLPGAVQNLLAQHAGAAQIDQQGFVVFVHQTFQLLHGAVVFGARERRHQVVDDDGLAAALGLSPFAGVVDDEG